MNTMRALFLFLLLPSTFILQAATRPNILFIIVDDQSPFDLKLYDPNSPLDTPVLDKLASDGMVFDGAYHMGAFIGGVCRPSRHMVMTGKTVWHLPNVRPPKKGKKNQPPKADMGGVPITPFDVEKYSMPALFNHAGYDTMRTCKNSNSYFAANALFTVQHDSTKRGGTDDSGSHWHAERVLEYLEEREKNKGTDPFLIYYGFSHPHDIRDGKPELLKKYGATNHKDRKVLPQLSPEKPTPELQINYLPAHPFFSRTS